MHHPSLHAGLSSAIFSAIQAELFGSLPSGLVSRPKPAPKRPHREVPIVTGGLFALVDEVSPERYSAAYHSGSSAYYDTVGLIEARKDIGVVADLLQLRVILRLRTYLRSQGKVFIDSGAYGAFKKWQQRQTSTPLADFAKVFAAYDEVIEDLPCDALQHLALVMPDVLAHPEWSLELLVQHRGKIQQYIEAGIQAIVPIQKAKTCAGVTADTVADILGTRNFTLGIPSAAAAMSLPDVATIRNHQRFHVLGRGAMGMPLFQRTYAFLEHNPGAMVSCDANQIRSHTDYLSFKHAELIAERDGAVWDGSFDETELIADILDGAGWLTAPQIRSLAASYGIYDQKVVKQWVKAHKSGEGLRDLVEEIDPELSLLWCYGLRVSLADAAEKHLSARLRAVAIADVFRMDVDAVPDVAFA